MNKDKKKRLNAEMPYSISILLPTFLNIKAVPVVFVLASVQSSKARAEVRTESQ